MQQLQLIVLAAKRAISESIAVTAASGAVITGECTGPCSPCFTTSSAMDVNVAKAEHVNHYLIVQLSSC